MGNCVEERGTAGLVTEIMDHWSNAHRDRHTQHSLSVALSRKTAQELIKILDEINNGNHLPDNFS